MAVPRDSNANSCRGWPPDGQRRPRRHLDWVFGGDFVHRTDDPFHVGRVEAVHCGMKHQHPRTRTAWAAKIAVALTVLTVAAFAATRSCKGF